MSNAQVPQTLKGFRDFLPAEKKQRDFVASRMKRAFKMAGFEPLETPTLEYASLLLGKYGSEADKLVYTFTDRGERQIGLRYDQTVPTSRVLGQYQNELPRFFRRYQIQNVFRADKPQKGRYREFTQCDCDIFGSQSPLADAEVLAVYYQAFAAVGFNSLIIEINDRQTLLNTLNPFATSGVDVFSIIQSIDKLDKQSAEEVIQELVSKGLDVAAAQAVITATASAVMSENLSAIIEAAVALGVKREALVFNPRIARGLDYYTGMIFEGKIPEYSAGSVGGGGRYDALLQNLAGIDMPAVGFGIGFDRTVEAASQLGLLPTEQQTKVLVTVFDTATQMTALNVAKQLRQAGIATEVYPAIEKVAKQLKLANQKNIPYAIIIGSEEQASNTLMLKDLSTGEQRQLSVDEAIATIL